MSKHTPGPWFYKEGSGFDYGSKSYGVGAPAPHYSVVPCLNINPADARLIAASPELLEALARLADLRDELPWAWDRFDAADAAIAKATGEAA